MILEKAFIVIFFVTLVSAIPQIRDLKGSPLGNLKKQKQENNKQNNLPLAISDYYDYWNYWNYDNYDYLEAWYDCDGDMCVDDHDWLRFDRKVEVDNSSLELTESEHFDVNTTSLWKECAPSVPLTGRLAKFKSCHKWAQDNDGIFNSYYSNNVCNFRKRMWLGQDGEIDGGKIKEMFKELEGFGEYLESCIQWNGEWPDYYDYDYDYYDYDYRVENGDDEKGANNKGNKEKSEKKGSKTKTKKRTEKKKKHHFGKKKKNNGKRKNGDRNGNAINGKNGNKKRKKNKNKNKQTKHKKNKGRRRKGKKAKKPNTKHNGIRYKREAAKDKKGKKNNNKKKKKQRQQKKALKLIELATLPTEQTVERLRCIEISVSSKLDQCGENILKNGLPPKHIGK